MKLHLQIASAVLFYIFVIQTNKNVQSYSDLDLTTTDMIRKEGYRAEEHTVLTDDGYLLKLHRIPGAPKSLAVILQHGLLSNSFDWVIAGKHKSLAFILADHGYDVWLGNARGNTYSRRHVRMSPSEPQFWNFSWHEMGIYDLPAVITYISKLKQDNITYVGHSMGTTMFYVMAIERPDIAAKVKAMFSFAPIAYMYHIQSMSRYFVPFIRQMQTLLPLLLRHTPAGTSTKTLFHYLQEGKTGKFQCYDYGRYKNIQLYNSENPPEYNVSKIQVPIGIFWSENDLFANPKDMNTFYTQIPNKILNYKVKSPKFSHVDFIWTIDAPMLLYSILINIYDLPALITYITDIKKDDIIYIGHSMGGTMFYIMATERPDIAAKVKAMFGFAPAAFMDNTKSLMRLLFPYTNQIEAFFKEKNIYELLSKSSLSDFVKNFACEINLTGSNMCVQLAFSLTGESTDHFNFNLIPLIMNHTLAGPSTKTFIHYFQLGKSKKFQHFDYGPLKNMKLYNSANPPEYDLSKIQVPIGIFWSKGDFLVAAEDIRRTYELLPNKILSYAVPSPTFNHVDFIWTKDATELLYGKVISVLENYV